MSLLATYVLKADDEVAATLHRYHDHNTATVTIDHGRLVIQGDDAMKLMEMSRAFEKAATALADEQLERADLEARGA